MALADMADDKGRSFPSQQYLGGRVAMSESTVRRALKDLEAAGWIEREHRQRRDGSRTSDLITIRDRIAEDAQLAAIRKLPLVAVMTGGISITPVDKPVYNPVDNSKSNRSNCTVGQPVKLTGNKTTTSMRLEKTTNGREAARRIGAAASLPDGQSVFEAALSVLKREAS